MYVSVSSGLAIRNDHYCSYLVRIDRVPDNPPLNKGVLVIPSFMGLIFSLLGTIPYDDNIKLIHDKTGLSEKAIRSFLDQLIENPESQSINIGSGITIVFPPFMLRKYDSPHHPHTFQVPDFNWKHEFNIHRPSIPLSVNLMVTTKCTTDCQYCYANRGLKSLLTTDELIRIVKDLKRKGVVNLSLTGGDIFALKGWQRLIDEVMKIGYNPFLSTKTPLPESDISLLRNLGCTELQFSLDSCDPTVLKELIHADDDYLIRFTEMMDACCKYGIKVLTRTVLTSLNSDLDDIKKLYGFFTKFPCITEWSLTPAFLSEYKEENYLKLEPRNEDLEKLYPFLTSSDLKITVVLNRLDEQGYKLQRCDTVEDFVTHNTICVANSTVISILANGQCSVCEMLYVHPEFILGDIRTDSIDNIWNSQKALDLYVAHQLQTDAKSPCHTCKVFSECKQSFGKRVCYMDIMKSGLPIDGPDPRCPKSPETDKIL